MPCLHAHFAAGFRAYEMEDDVTKDLAEFSLANAIYAALVEGHACEQSARYVQIHLNVIRRDNSCVPTVVTPWTTRQRMRRT